MHRGDTEKKGNDGSTFPVKILNKLGIFYLPAHGLVPLAHNCCEELPAQRIETN